MASDETITFRKVKTYSMPEEEWDDFGEWYRSFDENLQQLNSLGNSKSIRIDSTFDFQSVELQEALSSRIENKTETTGNFGYGKVMKNIIGEYEVVLEDKVGLQRKIAILQEIIEIFNNDERLTSEDPQPPEKIIDEGLANIGGEDAVVLAVASIANEDADKITVGKAMGYIGGNFPHLRPEMKTLAPLVGKQVGVINQMVQEGKLEEVKTEAESIYPDIFNKSEKEVVEIEPIFYQFEGNDLAPETVKYQVGEEVKTIELNKLIRKMKHDKAAYAWLNQHKPNGGPQFPTGGSGSFYLVISNDPLLNFTKSSGRYWEQNSCERYNSYDRNYSRGPLSDILYGNCVVFAFKGSSLPEGWPLVQPTKKPSNNIDDDPDGTLLGRQNIKWGYKENEEGNIGMGLDPAFYPRAGRQRWSSLLNRALAMIVDSLGYLDYTQMRTPYNYVGHCDVGSGVGNLVYREGTTCYTKIDNQQVNPDLIMAGNETIGYVAFDRLTRPIVDLNIKMILAQNPNIWAIAGNETGIARLIRTKNPDILKFLVASPNADTQALIEILNVLPEISNDWADPTNYSSLSYLIAKHPNANNDIHNKLAEMFTNANEQRIENMIEVTPDFDILSADNYGIRVLYGGIMVPDSNTPYICMGGPKIINTLLDDLNTDINIRQRVKITRALLFAPQLSKEQFISLTPHIKKMMGNIQDYPNSSKIINEFIKAYTIPLTVKDSWAFNDLDNFSISTYNNFSWKVSRQQTIYLDAIKRFINTYDNQKLLLLNTRNKTCYNWFWRNRKSLGLPNYLFTRDAIGVETQTKPYPIKFYDAKKFISCLGEDGLWEIRYSFKSEDDFVQILRKEYPDKFLQVIIGDVSLIQELGWGVVAEWLKTDKQFYQYLDILYQKAFGKLYLGNGKFAPPPEDVFELYSLVEDIEVLNDAATDAIFNQGGLVRNPNIPYNVQAMLTIQWPQLSEQYQGSYDEYYDIVQKEISANPNCNPNILQTLSEKDDYKYIIANNPNAFIKTLLKLYNQFPSQVMTNEGLSDKAYAKLWNNTWKIMTIPLIDNPNRMFDSFSTSTIFRGEKGSRMRNMIIDFIQANPEYKFWRAGNVKKGTFSKIAKQNMYSEPIADYPLFPKGKVLVIKFSDNIEDKTQNQLYQLDKMERVDDDTVFVEGNKIFYQEGYGMKTEHIAETLPLNEFFNFIPESLREEPTMEIDDEGNEVEIKPKRWTIDNIVVIQDSEVLRQSEDIPQWRFDLNQEQVNEILASYVQRGMDLTKLITELETPKNMKNYMLSYSELFKAIDENNLWTRDMINDNLDLIMRSGGALFQSFKNMPLTEKILTLSIASSLEELQQMGIYNLSLNDLTGVQSVILQTDNIPISYVYYILMNYTQPTVVNLARKIRGRRSQEFIDYYRIQNPPPERKK